MKKLMSILLAALLILGAAACAKKEAETPAPAASDALRRSDHRPGGLRRRTGPVQDPGRGAEL